MPYIMIKELTMEPWVSVEKMEGSYRGWGYVISRTAISFDVKGRFSEGAWIGTAFNSNMKMAMDSVMKGSPGECLVELTKQIDKSLLQK